MRKYTQLTRGKRYQIRALLKASFSQTEMAFFLKVHKSTISREIRRNRGDKGYRPVQAHQMTAYVENMKEVMGHSRWALVTTKPASYGMMRMLSAMLEPVPIIIRIFDTLEEADDWLSQPKGKKEPSMQS